MSQNTSHYPPLDNEWLDPTHQSSYTQSAVGASEGASDGIKASKGASPKQVRCVTRLTGDDPENGGLSLNAACLWGQTPASVAGSKSVPSGYHEDCKVRKSSIAELLILQDT